MAEQPGQLEERSIGRPRRVAKVVKGGRRFSFSAVVVVGDGNGRVGVGQGKAREVPAAIAKASESARKSMFDVPLVLATIPHQVLGEASGAVVMLKPASPGTGVIAGGPVRAVVEAAGIKDILSKSLGSSNPVNVVQAALLALTNLRDPQEVVHLRRRVVAPAAANGTARPAAAAAAASEPTAAPAPSARRLPSGPKTKASPAWCSTAVDTCTTVGSRRSRRAPGPPVWSSKHATP